MEWVAWFNNRRLLELIKDIPLAQNERKNILGWRSQAKRPVSNGNHLRKLDETHNAVESGHRQFRKLTKTKDGIANANSLLKPLYDDILKASGQRLIVKNKNYILF